MDEGEIPATAKSDLPRPTAWEVDCPCCGRALPYEPSEDDAGSWTPVEDWPVCEACNVMAEPPTVQIQEAASTYWVDRVSGFAPARQGERDAERGT